ncbi:hypothetical protein J2T10_003351 [Paenarthrobacter nicotinovorans]|uniref:Trypsin-like peptidase n=1 Tax=Paenarthrobacter nicotinovorans TaxID=29320 RepID=A0ABT9TPU7_PAENI|nr:trypsin-like peptidase domain-containing protein [Paenarthrobacter nicotinovorans]MDQ0103686.1 hypothetical protein [Paenarthrobacter nicotinovorans]
MDVNTISKQLLFTTAKITAHMPGGGISSGTGFIMDIGESGERIPILITNKHVVAGAQSLSVRLIGQAQGKPKLGLAHDFPFNPADLPFVGHPDPAIDITSVPLVPLIRDKESEVFIAPLHKSLLPSPEEGQLHDALEEVTFVGYPNGWADDAHHTPIVRRGITATPMSLRFGGNPVFLVDGSVFGGSSGSPVFLFNKGSYSDGQNGIIVGTRFQLVGVMAATMVRHSQLPLAVSTQPHAKLAQEMNLGVAFNWEAIAETVVELEKFYKITHPDPTKEEALAQPE